MDAFLISTGIVALAEMGDKTQLLAFMLAAKFRKPAPIIFGILVATLLNHGMAGALGTWIPHLLDAAILRWVLGIGFIVMAIWILIPDKLNEGDAKFVSLGVFGTTVVAFFLDEMGDKTQIATVALAAQYQSFIAVVLGTTVGMLLANAPAVLLGNKFASSLPTAWIHRVVAAIFAIMGLVVLLGLDSNLGL